jgi:predicted GH43/DUF377 family glycosyl hydrolase
MDRTRKIAVSTMVGIVLITAFIGAAIFMPFNGKPMVSTRVISRSSYMCKQECFDGYTVDIWLRSSGDVEYFGFDVYWP